MTNLFRNFVPNKLVTVDDRDPPWVTENINKLLKDKSKFYKEYMGILGNTKLCRTENRYFEGFSKKMIKTIIEKNATF